MHATFTDRNNMIHMILNSVPAGEPSGDIVDVLDCTIRIFSQIRRHCPDFSSPTFDCNSRYLLRIGSLPCFIQRVYMLCMSIVKLPTVSRAL